MRPDAAAGSAAGPDGCSGTATTAAGAASSGCSGLIDSAEKLGAERRL